MQVIKQKLIKIISGNKKKKKEIFNNISSVVAIENKISSIVSLFIPSFVKFNITKKYIIDINFIKNAYYLIISKINSKSFRKLKNDNNELLKQMDNYYISDFKDIVGSLEHSIRIQNMSHIFSASEVRLITSYETNIKVNFPTYIHKLVNYTFYTDEIKESFKKITNTTIKKKQKSEFFANLRKIKNDLLFGTLKSNDIYHQWITESNKNYIPLIPLKYSEEKYPLLNYLEKEPINFFYQMIDLNNFFEKNEKKLLQQFPLHTSLVPRHITLNTQAIIDLFVDRSFDYALLNINNKYFEPVKIITDLYSLKIKKEFDFTKISEKDLKLKTKEEIKEYRNIVREDKFRRAQMRAEIWKILFNIPEKYFDLSANKLFNNSIMTDGYSVSILLNEKSKLGSGSQKGKSPKRKSLFDNAYDYLEDLSKDEKTNILENNHVIGVDPGKKNLVQFIDSLDKNNQTTLRYTAIQRRRELKVETLNKKLRKYIKPTANCESSKTNNCDNFIKYVKNIIGLYNSTAYETSHKNIVKNIKFERYCLEKKTTDNFINRIKNTFDNKDGKEITLLYGNWSFTKQMKNFIPTPGIGLKNKLRKHFKIYNIDEFKTSQICHSCGKKTDYFVNIKNPKKNKDNIMIQHSLLRCTNVDNCNKIWSRDINGSLNILKIGLELLNNRDRPIQFARKKISSQSDEVQTSDTKEEKTLKCLVI
jgi:hypothetical protein